MARTVRKDSVPCGLSLRRSGPSWRETSQIIRSGKSYCHASPFCPIATEQPILVDQCFERETALFASEHQCCTGALRDRPALTVAN
uniref:Uncharacterized protein n=1 Tax=Trichuris muris TaxID=70415 RepID=A0A5S6QRX3_TRIMR